MASGYHAERRRPWTVSWSQTMEWVVFTILSSRPSTMGSWGQAPVAFCGNQSFSSRKCLRVWGLCFSHLGVLKADPRAHLAR